MDRASQGRPRLIASSTHELDGASSISVAPRARIQGRFKSSQPPFAAELIGPVRQAIVRARHCLVSQQQRDGTWPRQQSTDASLASQLVFLLAYLGREDSELAHQCAASILNNQRPDGGWRRGPDRPADVSISVQSYFALKLTGSDPSDERLASARNRIRQLGGADAADATTRFFLALLGQVSYDCCPATLPELNTCRGESRRSGIPLSVVWSHRPVRAIGLERGVRELFINKPTNWPRFASATKGGVFRQSLRAPLQRACLFAERRGWTPLRRHALASAESLLRRQVRSRPIADLDFHELVWHMIALDTIGYEANSLELRCCEARLHEMVNVDDASGFASPRIRATQGSETALAIRSLIGSGLSAECDTIESALDAACRVRSTATLPTIDLCNFVEALREVAAPGLEQDASLPPDIDVRWDWPLSTEQPGRFRRTPEKRKRTIARCIEKMLRHQNPNGGWSATLNAGMPFSQSEPDVSGAVIEALRGHDNPNVQLAVSRAATYLHATQQGDGSWASSTGGQQIRCTSQAIQGLLAAGATAEDDAVAAAVNWLIVRQQMGSGWIECEFDPELEAGRLQENPVEEDFDSGGRNRAKCPTQTAWAVLALVAAGKANHPAARRGIDLLLQSQDDEGGWHEGQSVMRDPATGHGSQNDVHSNSWPLLALSRWLVAANSTQSGAAGQMSLRLVGASAEN